MCPIISTTTLIISIHALLAESDLWVLRKVPLLGIFLSTLSLRRATLGAGKSCDVCGISIHALLAESDSARVNSMLTLIHFYPRSPCGERRLESIYSTSRFYFYPRSPCGERPPGIDLLNGEILFLSTLSLRRATYMGVTVLGIQHISIHALLAESDNVIVHSAHPHKSFLSTLSLRRATGKSSR